MVNKMTGAGKEQKSSDRNQPDIESKSVNTESREGKINRSVIENFETRKYHGNPEETKEAYPKGNIYFTLRDESGLKDVLYHS